MSKVRLSICLSVSVGRALTVVCVVGSDVSGAELIDHVRRRILEPAALQCGTLLANSLRIHVPLPHGTVHP
jgi:uncharacterized membrane protein YdcZ (DUF606 family)